MPSSPRFLIGFGERLTEPVPPPPGGGGAPSPYTSEQARQRLAPQLSRAVRSIRTLPAAACPDDRVVSVITLHPAFVAKSHFPGQLLRAAGMEPIGSRPRFVTPELTSHQTGVVDGKRTYESRPGTDERPTTELFVESTRSDVQRWATHLAKRQGMELFIVPDEERAEAEKYAGEMKVVGVHNLDDALHALAANGGNTDVVQQAAASRAPAATAH